MRLLNFDFYIASKIQHNTLIFNLNDTPQYSAAGHDVIALLKALKQSLRFLQLLFLGSQDHEIENQKDNCEHREHLSQNLTEPWRLGRRLHDPLGKNLTSKEARKQQKQGHNVFTHENSEIQATEP